MSHGDRRLILVITHLKRAEATAATQAVVQQLAVAGITPVFPDADLDELGALLEFVSLSDIDLLPLSQVNHERLELVIVLGGDGTILRAAEFVRDSPAPILGVNLGHVGFLAESEREALTETVRRAVDRSYTIEERLALDVKVLSEHHEVLHHDWALNEATVEKASRERMLELAIEVNGHPLSSFGADGMIVATPTGSTAYAFSSGGPVLWPNLDALLVVPISAHALFSKPLVLSPRSSVTIEVLGRNEGHGVLWCDGRRMVDLHPGYRITVSKSSTAVRFARINPGSFTERLVKKFNLPVTGWRDQNSVGDDSVGDDSAKGQGSA